MKRKALASVVLSLTLVVAACSDSVADSTEDLCNSLEALNDTMDQMAGATASADTVTVGAVQDATAEVQSAMQDVRDSESDLSESLKTQLLDDFEELQSSIQDIPADSTLTEAGQEVVTAVTTFKASWDQTLTELNCSGSEGS